MLVVEGFQKFAGIPYSISRICENLMPQRYNNNCSSPPKSLDLGLT
jgi:hypothetical protein